LFEKWAKKDSAFKADGQPFRRGAAMIDDVYLESRFGSLAGTRGIYLSRSHFFKDAGS
jgi:hypothetical protein